MEDALDAKSPRTCANRRCSPRPLDDVNFVHYQPPRLCAPLGSAEIGKGQAGE